MAKKAKRVPLPGAKFFRPGQGVTFCGHRTWDEGKKKENAKHRLQSDCIKESMGIHPYSIEPVRLKLKVRFLLHNSFSSIGKLQIIKDEISNYPNK